MTPQALTPAELDELSALEAKATPGPWRPEREPPPVGNVWFDAHTTDGSHPIEGQGGPGALGTAVAVAVNLNDAALIAALRNSAVELISAAEERGTLRIELAEVKRVDDEQMAHLSMCTTTAERERDAALARVRELEAREAALEGERDALDDDHEAAWQAAGGFAVDAETGISLAQHVKNALARAERAEKALRKLVEHHDLGCTMIQCGALYTHPDVDEARAALKGGE